MKKLLKMLFVSTVMFFTVGCVVYDHDLTPTAPPTVEDVDIVLRLKTPGAYPSSRTRALTELQEFTVSGIHVLAFREAGGVGVSDDELISISKGEMDAFTTEGTFTVKLSHSHLNKSRKLVVLANMSGISDISGTSGALSELASSLEASEVVTYAEVVGSLSAEITGKMFTGTYGANVGMIPMYGETDYKTITQQTTFSINLIRSVARIDIGVGQAQPEQAVMWPNATNIPFRLTEVYVMRPGKGYVVLPDPTKSSGVPTVPTSGAASGMFTVAESKSTFGYGSEAITDELYTMRSIYVPEALIVGGEFAERMALVVGGKYDDEGNGFDDDGVTYHRIDFYDGTALLNVLRNHLYRFEIAGVVGEGAADVESAYSSASANMTATVIEWDEAPLEEVHLKGDYYVSASPKTPATLGSVPATEGAANELKVVFETNITSGELEMFRSTVSSTPDLTISTPYENSNFTYTLAKTGQTYTLTITAKSTNFGTSAADIINDWTIDVGGVINFPYEVKQTAAATDPTLRKLTASAQYTTTEGDMGSVVTSRAQAAVGQSVTVSAVPRSGFDFIGWTVGGVTLTDDELKTNPLIFDMPGVSVSIQAGFKKQAEVYTIDVLRNNDDYGEAQANFTSATKDTPVSLLASPDRGYKFKEWSATKKGSSTPVTLTGLTANANPATFTMDEFDVEITATFETDPGSLTGGDYSVSITSTHGSAIASPAHADANDEVTIMATPTGDNKFVSWSVPVNATWKSDGSSTLTNPAKIIVSGTGNVTVTANYAALNAITMARNNSAYGTAYSSVAKAASGDKVSVTAVAAPGYVFKEWSEPTGTGSFNNPTANPAEYTMGAAAVTVTATFVRQERLLSVVPNNSDWGSVIVNPTAPVAGEVVTLTPNASTNFKFTAGSYTITPSTVTIGADNKFTMPADGTQVSVRVNFAPEARVLTLISPAAGGTVSGTNGTVTDNSVVSPGKTVNLAGGDRVTITAVPSDANYVFSSWSVNPSQTLTPNATSSTATFTMPQGNVSVTPQFDRVYTPQITATNGTYTMSAASAKANAEIKITAAPDANYRFVKWELTTANGASITPTSPSTNPTITLKMGTAQSGNPVLTATFERISDAYSIEVTEPANGKAQANLQLAQENDVVSLLATPGKGYKFSTWSVTEGGPLSGLSLTSNPAMFSMPAKAVKLTAIFVADIDKVAAYTVKATATAAHGSAVTSTGDADTGDEVTIMATPAGANYRFKEWTSLTNATYKSGSSKDTNPATVVVGSGNVTVTATFVALSAVTMKVNDTSMGEAKTNMALAASGDVVTVTAAPKPGYIFTGWSSSPSTTFSSSDESNPATFIMGSAAIEVTATFARQTQSLSVVSNNTNWGSVSQGVANPNPNETVTITAAETNAYYKFVNWTVTEPSSGVTPASATSKSTTITMPASGKVSVRANFAPVDRTVTITGVAGGTVTVSNGTATKTVTTTTGTLTVAGGDLITITSVPSTGYRFASWTSPTTPAPSSSTATVATFTMPQSNVTVTPSYTTLLKPTYAANPTAGGTVTAAAEYAASGEKIKYTAGANSNYRFTGWTISGTGSTPASATTPTVEVTLGSVAPTVTANFVQLYTVSPGTLTNGTASSSVTSAAANDTNIKITATPNAGYIFSSWSMNPSTTLTGTNPATFTMPASNVTFTPTFVKQTEPLSVVSNNDDWGTISASPSSPQAGAEVTLTPASKDSNKYVFDSYTVINGGTTNPITATSIVSNKFTMPGGQVAIRANFKPVPRTVTLTAVTGGTVTVSNGTSSITSGTLTAAAGDIITITSVPSTGYRFASWTSPASGVATISPNTTTAVAKFTMPQSNVTVTPSYTTLLKPTYAASPTAGGTVTAAAEYAAAGEKIKYTAGANTNYRFTSWTISGTGSTPASATTPTVEVTLGSVAPTVTANFVQLYNVTKGTLSNGKAEASVAQAAKDETVTISAVPDANYIFSSWTMSPTTVTLTGTNPATFPMPAQAVTFTPTFVKQTEPLSVVVNNKDWGSFSISPTSPKAGESVTITPSASTNYVYNSYDLVNPTSLTGWTVNSTTKAASFTMPTGLVQIRLNFKPVDRTITITGVTGGTVTASNGTATKTVTTTTGTLTVAGGDLITITSVPGTGYRFLKWTSPTTPAPADANASVTTFTMPQSNVTVTASFVAKTPDLYSVGTAVNNSTGGSAKVTAEGSTTAITSAEAGVGVTFTPTPSSDWNFSNWTVKSGTKPYGFGSSSTNASSPLTVAMPSSDLVLQANFTQKLHYITASKNPTATTGSFTVDPSNALTSGSGQITGTAVTLTAPTSDVSKVFTGWTLSGLTLTNSTTTSSNPIKFNMPANDTSTATANYTAAAITTSATSLAAHTSDTGSASANNKTFTVTSNIPWKVAYPTNFSGSPTAGTSQAAGTNVTVTVWPTSANTSGDTDRTGNVTVSAYNSGTGAADKTVAVTQSHATTTWTVSPTTTQAFASTEYDSGVAHTITVTSNATWKATSNSTNFTVVMRNSAGTTQSTSVTGNGTVLVYPASVNTTTTARTATLTIAGTIETSKSTAISLSQAGMLTASAAVSPTSSGTVKINGGTAAAAPSATFHSGTSVNFEAVPATNYRFVKWSNGSTSNPLTLTNQTAGVTLTATFAVHKDGSSPYLLYWDEASQTMQLGIWTSQGGNANSNNQLLFQFGSVVGMTNTATADGTAWPGTSTIKFNPTSTATTSFTWTTIPNWNGTDTTDGYISSSSYHTLANVQAGRGDPCKLVGLTVAQIKAGVYDSGRYRLPTASENEAYDSPEYTGGTSGWSSTPVTAGIYYLPVSPNKFLPATGRRDASDGATNYVGTVGNYWSSRASSGTAGYSLFFNSNSVYPDYAYSARIGFPVRCVLQ